MRKIHRVSTIVEILCFHGTLGGQALRTSLCGGMAPPFPPAAYAACAGGLQERLAPKGGSATVAGSYTDQHDNPHSAPLPRPPPNMATATIALLNQHPSHSYVVSLPNTAVGILPMSDASSIFEIYPPVVPPTVIPVLMYPVPSELYGGTGLM